MPVFFKRRGAEDYLSYNSKYRTIKQLGAFRSHISLLAGIPLFLSFFLSPVFFFFLATLALQEFAFTIYREYLSDSRKMEKYKDILAPKSSSVTVGAVGYQVAPEELDQHVAIVKRGDDEAKDILKQKQKAMSTRANAWRLFGLDRDKLVTHLMIPGKTGAGKTELIRSIAEDAALNLGGGLLFNDGKSDTRMLREFVDQALRAKRETSIRIINYLKMEKAAESHTFSFLQMMHPVKTVDFMGDLIGGGGGEGNAKYFFQQGKTMMFPVVHAIYIRHDLFREGYTLEKIFENTKLHNLVLMNVTFYCMSREISEMIMDSPILKGLIFSYGISAGGEDLQPVRTLIEYMIENPAKKGIVKKEIGIDYERVREIYINTYSLLNSYMVKIWNQFDNLLGVVSRAVYIGLKSNGKNFLGEDGVKISEIRNLIREYKMTLFPHEKGEEIQKFIEAYPSFLSSGEFNQNEIVLLRDAFHRPLGKGGNIDTPPADAIQQLAYAQQQWNVLVNISAAFSHVLGQTYPEIDPVQLLTDNQFNYTLLPPLEVNPDITEVLGRIMVSTIQQVAAIALLGEKISLHPTLEHIHRDKYTPKPFTFVVLDEYGAYPVPGLALLLAQARSLSISIAVAIQDFASLKVGGTDVTSQERALANTTKVIGKSEDKETIEWVKSMMSETYVETPKLQKDVEGEWAATVDTEITKAATFDAQKLRDFGNGFALVMLGSEEEDLVFVQSFYRGGKVGAFNLTRFQPIEVYAA
jgi:hypothetical protein